MSRADQMLQSAYRFMEEGNKRMTKGLAEKNLDELEAAQKIIQLAQKKAAESPGGVENCSQRKEKVKTWKKGYQKTKSQVNVCFKIYYFCSYWTTMTELTKD